MLGNRLVKLYKKIAETQSIKDLESLSEEILKIDVRIIVDEKKRVSNLRTHIKNSLCKALMEREKSLCKGKIIKLSLTNLFSKKLFNGREINKLPLTRHSRTIGTIPYVFIEKSINSKKTSIEIFDLLSEYSMKLNYDFEFKVQTFEGEKEFLLLNIKQFEKDLAKITGQKVKLEFIGSGFNGNGFKLTIANKVFCYKTFYIYNPDDAPNTCCHGTLAEAQMALFASKNSRKGQFSKFYFGKVGYKYNIDSFVVTEFVDKNNNRNKNNRFYIDHITTMDSNPRNRVNGKIVDFGATKIGIPELSDKQLQQMVRIICNSMYMYFDQSKISYHWFLNKNNINQLKKYLVNIDPKLYQKAFEIILTYSVGMPLDMQKFFKNLKSEQLENNIVFEEVLNTKHLFTTNIEELKFNVELFNILKTETPPMPIFNSAGYIIIDLYNDYQAVCFYRENIEKIRIEKLEGEEFRTILEITADEFESFPLQNMYELLK